MRERTHKRAVLPRALHGGLHVVIILPDGSIRPTQQLHATLLIAIPCFHKVLV